MHRGAGARPESVSVVLATYRQPEWLEKALWGYANQTHQDFEIVIADDGSGPETAAVVRRIRYRTEVPIHHVWQEDRGHRKCVALNRAVLRASGEYLVFSDGDCVPREDFVEVHARLAEPERFLSGGAVPLSRGLSESLAVEDIRTGAAFRPRWLHRRGWRPGRRLLRTLRWEPVSAALDLLTPTSATWNGNNASTWRDAVLAVNGFEAEMGYGGQDRAFGERLVNFGYRGKQIRHRAVALHLAHDRPYATEESIRKNDGIRERIRRRREVRARHGLRELVSGEADR